jgi:hypothetical protein
MCLSMSAQDTIRAHTQVRPYGGYSGHNEYHFKLKEVLVAITKMRLCRDEDA